MKHPTFKLRIAMISLLILLFIPIMQLSATQRFQTAVDEARQAQRDHFRQISDHQALVDDLQGEMALVLAQMQALDQEFIDFAQALVVTQDALAITEARIAVAEAELEQATYDRDRQFELFRISLRSSHEMGPVGLLEVLLRAESFADFLTLFESARLIAESDQAILTDLETIEQAIAYHVNTLHANRIQLEDLMIGQHIAQMELDNNRAEREAFFAALQEDQVRMTAFLAILEEENRVLLGAVRTAETALANEEERIRQEEIARAAAEAAARAAAERAARLQTLNAPTNPFQWPVPTHSNISSPFGNRPNPFSPQNTEFHTGIDINAPTGTRIVAAQDGIVYFAGWSGGFGLTIIIDHYGGYRTLYAHNSVNRVSAGDRVTRGQHIGDIGSTGQSTGPHLHFEIIRDGTRVNPSQYFG